MYMFGEFYRHANFKYWQQLWSLYSSGTNLFAIAGHFVSYCTAE